MKNKKTLLLLTFFLFGFWVKAQNYSHLVSTIAYKDLVNAQDIHGSDSIASAYYVDINMLFPAYGAFADFNSVPSIPSYGAYVTRNGYVAAYEKPSYGYTFAFHAYLNNLKKINSSSSISVLLVPKGSYNILKFQWKNMGILNHADTEYVNFQIWFDEAQKSISYHYGPSNINDSSNAGGAIGLLRAPNSFSNFTHATYLQGDAKNPDELLAYNPSSFANLVNSNNFPPTGTLITFKLPSTGIEDNNLNKSKCSIYPNPFNERLDITYEGNLYWQIFDMFGKQINNGNGLDFISINTMDLASGLYKLRLENSDGIVVKKILKQ